MHDTKTEHEGVEMPRPTAAPLVLSLGAALAVSGLSLGPVFGVVGGVVFVWGLTLWIGELLPGRGHVLDPRAERVPAAVVQAAKPIPHLVEGEPGYRLRLPLHVRPISAGVKGGIAGGLAMPIPTLLFGVVSGRGVWYPVNLLAGMLLPGIGDLSETELAEFRAVPFGVAVVIHVVLSLTIGLIYGVLLPMLPPLRRSLAWAGLLAPMLWTGACYTTLFAVNPGFVERVSWAWFALSQFVFGIALAVVFTATRDRHPLAAGAIGGLVGGLLMPIPAILWSLATGHGFWYPSNLLAGLVLPGLESLPTADLEVFRLDWFAAAVALHVTFCLVFGGLLMLLLPRLRPIPGQIAWGSLVLPLLWSAASYTLMGVANGPLAERVDWPWFVASQFVFGLVTSLVVERAEAIPVVPAGHGKSAAGGAR